MVRLDGSCAVLGGTSYARSRPPAERGGGTAGTQVSFEDVDASKYLNIQTVLDNPDAVKEAFVDGKRTVVFIKKIGRYFAELT